MNPISYFLALAITLGAPAFVHAQPPTETDAAWRPVYHFSPRSNFMNDPNGMVFYNGRYHLFFQYNPQGTRWGHMSWGHATSTDLVSWAEQPVALQEAGDTMIFSGSAVVDWANTSGFGSAKEPPLVAIYTGRTPTNQSQHVAFSVDGGQSWTKYAGNPVLDLHKKDFRDPKVFWHKESRRWIMVAAMPEERQVGFFGSPNLKDWTLLSTFGPAGATKGVWECPDLFPLPFKVNGKLQTKWVLLVSGSPGGPAGGSATQYFVGAYDGNFFTVDDAPRPAWVDYGKDFYAAVTWSDLPKKDGRRLLLGWMSNWEYTESVPTTTYRNAQSLPRALSLANADGRAVLVQTPVAELAKLRQKRVVASHKALHEGADVQVPGMAGTSYELVAEFTTTPGTEVGVKVRASAQATGQQRTLVGYKAGQAFIDRTDSGRVDFAKTFAGRHVAPVREDVNGHVTLHVFVDRSSIEAFVNDGRATLTDTIFPSPDSEGLAFYTKGGTATLERAQFWPLRSTNSR